MRLSILLGKCHTAQGGGEKTVQDYWSDRDIDSSGELMAAW